MKPIHGRAKYICPCKQKMELNGLLYVEERKGDKVTTHSVRNCICCNKYIVVSELEMVL